jgi:hypothetical protein
MLRLHQAALNPSTSAGPPLGHQNPLLSRATGSFSDPKRPLHASKRTDRLRPAQPSPPIIVHFGAANARNALRNSARRFGLRFDVWWLVERPNLPSRRGPIQPHCLDPRISSIPPLK